MYLMQKGRDHGMKVPKKPLLVGSMVVTMALALTGCSDEWLRNGPYVAYGVTVPIHISDEIHTTAADTDEGLVSPEVPV